MSDISGLIGSTGIALEGEAYKQFGAAVENQAGGLLGQVFGKPNQPASGPNDASSVVKNAKPGVWDTTPYASALTNFSGGYDPKNKFLFKVRFVFYPEAAKIAASMGFDVDAMNQDLTFVVKSIDLPKVKFDYEEVNMYNFKTKVLKSISHDNLSLTFYDDVSNHALSFVNAYMMIISPITRNELTMGTVIEDHGFAFNPSYSGLDTGNRGAMYGRKDIISTLVIEQFYVNMSVKSPNSLANLVHVNSFNFSNPRLHDFNIQDQNHETGSEPNTITATFDYDALHIHTGIKGIDSITGNFPGGDILHGFTTTEAAAIRSQSGNPAGGSKNPLINILANQGGRMVQTSVGNFLSKNLGGIAGGALQGAIGNVSGTLAQQAGNTLSNAASGIAQSFAAPSPSLVTDNAGSPTPPSQVVSSPNE